MRQRETMMEAMGLAAMECECGHTDDDHDWPDDQTLPGECDLCVCVVFRSA
jgi:hypothetical protein